MPNLVAFEPSVKHALNEGEPEASRGEQPYSGACPASEHDSTLLVAALEQCAAQRAAMEWLLEADLFRAVLQGDPLDGSCGTAAEAAQFDRRSTPNYASRR